MEKYINQDEYLKAKGINLSIEIQDDDDPSNKVERFIQEVTDWCEDYLVENYNNDVRLAQGFDKLLPIQQELFRRGVVEQIEYVLRNGWLNKDSGYNAEMNSIIDLEHITLAPTAFAKFRRGGLANTRMTYRGF